MPTITVRAGDQTPRDLRYLDMEKWLGTPAEMIDLPSFGMTLADYRKQVDEQWSAPAAASSDSSSATGTAPTEPSGGKG